MAPPAPLADEASLRAALDAAPGLRDLLASMDAIKLAVEKVWKENHQPWFTDHGPRHSDRTAAYALTLADLAGISPQLWLTPLEAYVLWAAAWLHDVGMQDLLAASAAVGQIDAKGFDAVRHQHPHQSSERILNNTDKLGLPEEDLALVQAVASVARAHGTRFYADTIANRLNVETTVRNEPVRARLLAALLLFADELDLHYERASAPAGFAAVDNDISEAHKFKHRSVWRVTPVLGPGGRIAVRLELAFPKGVPDADRDAVRRWIEVKLRRQMSLIEPEIVEGFGGQVRLARLVDTSVIELLAAKPAPGDAALSVIRAETARDELINHAGAYDAVTAGVGGGGIVVVSDGSPDPDADDGSGDLLDAACAAAAAAGRAVCLSRRPELSGGATAADVVGEWAAAMGHPEPPAHQDEHSRRQAALSSVLLDLIQQQRPLLFAVARAQDVDAESLAWLRDHAVPAIRSASDDAAVLLTAAATTPFAVAGEAVVSVALGPTDRQAAEDFLGRLVDRGVAAAESWSLQRYSLIKRTAQYHDLQLRGEL